MLADYLTLGLAPDATDTKIRKAYLTLIRRHTPEKDAPRFKEITAAYERIKDEPARLQTALLGPLSITDAREALSALVRVASPGKRRAGLISLMDSVAAAARKRL